ncbi:MAG: 4Fe-4S dicluster domain-containing protein [Solirubrobacterales bacterium]|nr:4Fe-4S dicluster domain-containing protein [Solirubrobacterales bacterium]MBV9717638.1 4Fe-4S dicluster domain-containing protein [Solirubrobacterales bacterium]
MSDAPTEVAVHRSGQPPGRLGFFTDTTVCIGCKSCEVACKQWNDLPADGYTFGKGRRSLDHTGSLSSSSWRHVHFVEIAAPHEPDREAARAALGAGAGGQLPNIPATGALAAVREDVDLLAMADGAALPEAEIDRWLFDSDVCKHCTNAGCLDACPTGALIRTEFETVIVQPDICNGCGYCVPSCPFGVIDRDPYDGRAAKCTLCYDRLQDGLEPACAKACPTDSIQFGPYEELVERAKGRVTELHARGLETAYLYGAGDEGADQLAGGLGAFFLLTEPPERFGLPAQADSPIQANMPAATAAGLAAGVTAAAAAVVSLVFAHRRARR